MMNPSVHFITAGIYIAAVLVARMTSRVPSRLADSDGALSDSGATFRWMRWLAAAGIASHAVTLFGELFSGDGLNIGFSHAVSVIVWMSFSAYFLIGLDNRLIHVAITYLAPLAAMAVLLPFFLPAHRVVNYGGMAFKAHFVAAILAYSLFTVAAIHSMLMLSMEKWLHAGNLPPALQGMPSLLRMERLLFQLLMTAFLLLSVAVVSGLLFSETLFGKPFQLTHKTVFAIFSWCIFGGLLLGHWRYGWRGKLAIRWTLAGFVLLLLSYIGSKFVLEILLGRQ